MPRMNSQAAALLQRITDFYLKSRDFNGILVDDLPQRLQPSALEALKSLVLSGLVEVYSTEYEVNAHIKRLPALEISRQLHFLENMTEQHVCVYPSVKHMRRVLPGRKYRNKPFTRFLALGHAQLESVYFQLGVLGRYQSDPRYIFRFDGLDGHISVREADYRKREMGQADKIMLETFGIGTDAKGNRVIVSFPRYLSYLSARHQQHWQSYRVSGKCKMERNYGLRGIWGKWTDGISIYEALLEEISHINKMCQQIGLPELFRRNYSAESRDYEDDTPLEEPKAFGLLLVPTKKHYLEFASVLDKIISENLNTRFFTAQGIDSEEQILKDGQAVVVQKGTLRLLEEWLIKRIRISHANGPAIIMQPLKEVRKLRQSPAHKFVDDEYSIKYQGLKEKLILDVYTAISNIRMFFQTHPKANNYEFPKHLKLENLVIF